MKRTSTSFYEKTRRAHAKKVRGQVHTKKLRDGQLSIS